MLNKLNDRERERLAAVKELACSMCDTPDLSEAHHVKQNRQYVCIALCESRHRGSLLGLHGQGPHSSRSAGFLLCSCFGDAIPLGCDVSAALTRC